MKTSIDSAPQPNRWGETLEAAIRDRAQQLIEQAVLGIYLSGGNTWRVCEGESSMA